MNLNSLIIGKRAALWVAAILVIPGILRTSALAGKPEVKDTDIQIQTESAPAVAVANEGGPDVLQSLYQMRKYAYAEDPSLLAAFGDAMKGHSLIIMTKIKGSVQSLIHSTKS